MICKDYSKSFMGFKTMILSKLTALTIFNPNYALGIYSKLKMQ